VGIALGIRRAGLPGAVAAWTGFTMPSALVLIAFAYGMAHYPDTASSGWVHGLKVVAVAVVAQAVWGMGNALCPDRPRATLAIGAAVAVLAWPSALMQVLVIVAGGLIGWRLVPTPDDGAHEPLDIPISKRTGLAVLVLFFGLLVFLPGFAAADGSRALGLFDAFYRAGSLVFGGGHVVLPLLRAEVVPSGWVSDAEFLAGYGAAQAVPGPLFTFAAYLGAVMNGDLRGWAGGLIGLAAIFLPAFLLVIGALPFWDELRRRKAVAAAMGGVNAAVVGILLAALYDPIWTTAIRSHFDFILAVGGFGALVLWKVPPVYVVGATAAAAGLVLAST
jgi:chromate transporter